MMNHMRGTFTPSWRALLAGCCIVVVLHAAPVQQALAGGKDLMDQLKNAAESLQKGKLSTDEIIEGLKEALRVGSRKALDILGKQDGFYSDEAVRILMPESLQKVEKLLLKFGQKKLVDKFVKTMNRAAEKSVQSTFEIFVDAIKHMSIEDAMKIFKGSEDEATRYFRASKQKELYAIILPIVREATDKTEVTATYEKIAKSVQKLQPSLAESMPDINNYVTEKTLDGIFLKLAKEEAAIRKDPVARTTDILKKVFN